MGYSFLLAARDLLHAPSNRQDSLFFTPIMEHWLEWEITWLVHHEGLIRWPITPWVDHWMLYHTATSCSYPGTKREREMFYLTTHSTHFIYGYMASDIWLRTILIVREETRCRHIGYSFRLAARVLLYAPSHRQDSTYHSLCYTSRGALAGTRNSSMGPGTKCNREKNTNI